MITNVFCHSNYHNNIFKSSSVEIKLELIVGVDSVEWHPHFRDPRTKKIIR
jgi:hypothetical protein